MFSISLCFPLEDISLLGSTPMTRMSLELPAIILAAVNQFCDCMNIVAAGILRGQGRQKIGSYINMVAYYIIALPLAYVLAFVADLEVYGLWLGLVCGIAVLALGEVYFAIKADWDRIVVTCRESHDH